MEQNKICTELAIKDKMTDKDIKVIYQFLLDHNFENTAGILIQEASKMGIQNLERQLETIIDPYIQLMLCYNIGDYSTFFQLWNDLFPESIKQHEEYKKLTFYLHIYFAILPKLYAHGYKECRSELDTPKSFSTKEDLIEKYKKNNATEIEKDINNSMKQLQDYLNEDGKELEQDIELQPFFALPFIEDLQADTFFSEILEQCWLDKLSKNLDLFISNNRQTYTTLPETRIKNAESEVTQDKIPKYNVPIVPNDRDIPIFLEDNYFEEQYTFHKTSNLKSRATQTYITEDQITINHLRKAKQDLGENIDNLIKIHEQDKKLIECNQELALTKARLHNIYTKHEKLKLTFHKLHADYHKLGHIARVLTMAFENSVKGQSVSIQQTLEICMKIFPDFFNQNIRETSCSSLLQFSYTDVRTIALPKLDVIAAPVSPKLLDFKKIKLHLLNGDVKTKLLLLQALRWKITLTQSAEQDEVLHEYISRDLLGLHGQIANDTDRPILPYLLTVTETYARHLLQQFTARLLNTLASFRCGRDYLSVGSTVVNVAFTCLDNNYIDGMDPLACDMMIAMLQKLSLRRQQRIYMIESGLLEWLINHLHDKCRIMNLYRLEYATALLMNLSLHRLAQARASKISSVLVSTLLILLSIDQESSLRYTNRALNNFLNNPVINEEVKKIKRSDTLDYIGCNQKTAEIKKHLEHIHILKMQRNINTPQNEETADDDDNEELDVLENELDENDPLKNYVGELNGETLLATCYSVPLKIPQDAITMDTTLQKISMLNPIDFYNNQQNNHLCAKHPSYPIRRYNIKMQKDVLPKEIYNKQSPLMIKQASSLSSLQEQEILKNNSNKEFLSADKVQNNTKDFVGNASSLIIKHENTIYEKQNENLLLLKNWSSSKISNRNYSQFLFDYDNYVRTETNARLKKNNIQENQSKLCKAKNKINIRLYDGKFEKTNLEKLSSKAMKIFKQNFSGRMTANDIIDLFKNQSSKNSSETVVISSMALASDHENGLAAEAEKLSSIASLNNYDSNVINDTSWKNNSEIAKEEEAFLSKPKLSRTPP